MKYKYLYQDSSNVNHEGEIDAKNRADAYARLRKSGIRPYRLIGDDPINWQPWAIAIGYAILLGALAYTTIRLVGETEEKPKIEMNAVEAAELRARAEEAVYKAPEQFRYDVWKGVNARLIERGIEPIEKPVDLGEDDGFKW